MLKLKVLDLSVNKITEIPKSVLNCKRSTKYKLGGNPIELVNYEIEYFIWLGYQ
jgi:Leucine-rich repeat (LRR) protein